VILRADRILLFSVSIVVGSCLTASIESLNEPVMSGADINALLISFIELLSSSADGDTLLQAGVISVTWLATIFAA
jgi:hypothetical protein